MAAAAADNLIEFRVGSILRESLDIFRRNFWRFLLVTVALDILLVLLSAVLGAGDGQFNSSFGYSYDSHTNRWTFQSSGLRSLLNLTIAGIAQLTVGGLLQYWSFQSLRQDGVSTSGVLAKIGQRLLPMILTSIVVYLAILAGMVILVVPGVLFALSFSVSVTVCLMEERGVGDSLTRSRNLTRGYRGRIFLAFVIFFVVSTIVSKLVEVAAGEVHSAILTAVAAILWQSLVTAFAAAMIAAIYYYLRVIKDGVDIHQIAAVFD